MGLSIYQCLFCWILMCVSPAHLKAASLSQINPQTKPEITNGHVNTPTVPILDTSLASNRMKSPKIALSQIIAQSYNKATDRSDDNFSLSNSQAKSPELYNEKTFRKIPTHPMIVVNNRDTGLQSRSHAVKRNKTSDPYLSFLFSSINFPPQPPRQQNDHNKVPGLQPTFRFARNAPPQENKTHEEANRLNLTDSNTNDTTKSTDNILKVGSDYIEMDYHKVNKTSKVLRNFHNHQNNNSGSEVSNFTENVTKIENLLKQNGNIEHEDDPNSSESTTTVDDLLKDQNTSINFDDSNASKTTTTVDGLIKDQNTSINFGDSNASKTTTIVDGPIKDQNTSINFGDSNASKTTTTVDGLIKDQKNGISDSNTTTRTHVSYESTRSKTTTELSNVIPRGPFIREEPDSNTPVTETTSPSPISEDLTSLPMDGSTFFGILTKAINTSTESHDNPNHLGEERVHNHDPTNETLPETATNLDAHSHSSDTSTYAKQATDKDTSVNNRNEATDLFNDILVQISLYSNGDSMVVSWVVDTNYTQISGFLVSYRMNEREDFDSSSLGASVRSFTLHSLHEDKEYVICVHAVVNDTVVKSACAEWSKSSMKMVVGILAGVIFLLPCIVVIVLILHRDYKVKQKASFRKLTDDTNECDDHNISYTKAKHAHSHEKNDNSRLTVDDKVIVVSGRRSSNNHHHEAGHENPCGSATGDSIEHEVKDVL